MPTSVRRRYWKIVYDYCGLDEYSRSSFRAKRKKQEPNASSVPTQVQPSKGEEEHLVRATRALHDLRVAGYHLPYFSTTESAPSPLPEKTPTETQIPNAAQSDISSFSLPHRYLVPFRSNLVVDGYDPEEGNRQSRSKLFSDARCSHHTGTSTVLCLGSVAQDKSIEK